MRLFVALDIPDAIRAALAKLIERLQGTARGARWVRAESVHVTLKFIGEVPEERISAIEEALARVHNGAPVEADFHGMGFFPNERRPRVLWVGVKAPPNLAELAAAVGANLTKLGIEGETRAYAPHLTLARFKSEEGLPRLLDEIRKIGAPEFGTIRTSEFHLFRSELLRGGARYTRLKTFPFIESRP